MTAPTQPIQPLPAITVTGSPTSPSSTVQMLKEITDPFGVYCVLELRFPTDAEGSRAGKSVFHVFPVMPESMRLAQRYLQTITPTQGGVFIDEFGRAPSPVFLQGTFGRSPKVDIREVVDLAAKNATLLGGRFDITTQWKKVKKKNKDGSETEVDVDTGLFAGSTERFAQAKDFDLANANPVTGYKLVRLLSLMVDLSHEPTGATGKLPQVFFYNFGFGQFYEVALNSFQAQMNVEANGLWTYQLEMTLLRPIGTDQHQFTRSQTADAALRFLISTPPKVSANDKRGNLLQRILNTFQNVRSAVLRASVFAARLQGGDLLGLGLGFFNNLLGLSPGTLSNFYTSLQTLPTLLTFATNALAAPRRVFEEAAREINQTRIAIGDAWSQFSVAADAFLENDLQTTQAAYSPALAVTVPLDAAVWNGSQSQDDEKRALTFELLESASLAREAIQAVDVLAAVQGQQDLSYTNPVSTAPTVFTESASASAQDYQIRQGDTLASIAVRQYGSADSWPLVASQLPAAMQGLSPTQPLNDFVGVSIAVPTSTQAARTLVPYVWDAPVGLAALGRDLSADMRTQTRADGTTELSTLGYQGTLLQGLAQRMTLPPGACIDTPSFGSNLPLTVGQNFGVLQREMTRVFVQQAVLNDPRIASLSDLQVAQSVDGVLVQFTATTTNNVTLRAEELVVTSN